jgi:hypothetical protein
MGDFKDNYCHIQPPVTGYVYGDVLKNAGAGEGYNDASGAELPISEQSAQHSVMATARIVLCDRVVIWPHPVNLAAAQQLTIRRAVSAQARHEPLRH